MRSHKRIIVVNRRVDSHSDLLRKVKGWAVRFDFVVGGPEKIDP